MKCHSRGKVNGNAIMKMFSLVSFAEEFSILRKMCQKS